MKQHIRMAENSQIPKRSILRPVFRLCVYLTVLIGCAFQSDYICEDYFQYPTTSNFSILDPLSIITLQLGPLSRSPLSLPSLALALSVLSPFSRSPLFLPSPSFPLFTALSSPADEKRGMQCQCREGEGRGRKTVLPWPFRPGKDFCKYLDVMHLFSSRPLI